MRKKFYLSVVIAVCLFLLSPSIQAQSNWYKNIEATIGRYPIVMHLNKMGNTIAGYYYYKTTQEPVYVIGNDTAAGAGKIILYGYSPEDVLTVSIQNGKCSGEWKKAMNENEKYTGPMTLPITGTEKIVSSAMRFDMIYVNGTKDLRPKIKESPYATFEAATIWPGSGVKQGVAIRKFINRQFGAADANTNIKQELIQQQEEFFKGYFDENKNVADSEMVDYPSAYNQESSQWVTIAYQSPKILTLANWNYLFMGGAHGSYTTLYKSINLETGKELMLEDVLTPAGIKALPGLLERQFRKTNGLSDKDPLTEAGLFEDTIKATENFYVTAGGIGFGYAPYEIGPYAMGEVNIFLRFNDLRLAYYLKPAFKNLISN